MPRPFPVFGAVWSRGVNAGLCLSLCILGLAPAWGADAVRVGIYQNRPEVAVSDAGRPEGIFIDLIEGIAKKEGWAVEYVPGTWEQGLERLAQGDIDLMPDVARTREREALLAFHQEPVLASWSQVYVRRGSGLRSLPDLGGRRVAVLSGSEQARQFEQLVASFGLVVQWVPQRDDAAAFAAVAQGRADAVVTRRFLGVRNAPRYGLEETAIIFNPSRLYIAAPLKGREALLEAIDRRMVEFKKDPGSLYYRSLRRWSVGDVRSAAPPWLWQASLAALIVLLAAAAWVLLLRRQVALRTRELRQRNREVTISNETLRAIGARRDLEGVLQEALRGALALAELSGGALCLRDESHDVLRLAACLSVADDVAANDARSGDLCETECQAVFQSMAQAGQRHVLLSADETARHRSCCGSDDPRVRWKAYFRLQAQDRMLGVLCLISHHPQPPSGLMLGLVDDLCGPVAQAIENAQRHAQAQTHTLAPAQRDGSRGQAQANG